MERFNDYKKHFEDYLNKKNSFTDVLIIVEDKLRVSRVNFCFGLILSILTYLIFGYGGTFLANFIGFIYPAYCSVKAIESIEKDDDTKWLTYWVVYASFSVVESFTDIFLYWIPLYALLKCIFLVYLMVPSKYNGSIFLYKNYIKPCVLKNQAKIDEFISETEDVAKNVLHTATEAGEQVIKERIIDSVAH